MINRDLIRRKIVQLTYAYYQNSNHNMDNAEKELMFSLSKSYDLYNYMLQLIVAITGEARKRYDVEVVRAQREGLQEPSARLAFNKFAVQLEENKMLLDWIDVKHSNWDENIEVVRSLYKLRTTSMFSSQLECFTSIQSSNILFSSNCTANLLNAKRADGS